MENGQAARRPRAAPARVMDPIQHARTRVMAALQGWAPGGQAVRGWQRRPVTSTRVQDPTAVLY